MMFFTPAERATIKAMELNAGALAENDGWRYEAKTVAPNKAIIEVYDEDGHHVGNI